MWIEAQELAAKELVKEFEGLSLVPYICAGGKATIGYGSTRNVNMHMQPISRAYADELLFADLAEADLAIDRHVKVDLNLHQRASLISWCYNLGEGNLKSSTMLKKLNRMDYKGAADEMLKWVYANKKKLRGLERRRKAERDLFLKPIVPKPAAVKVKQAAPMATAGVAAGLAAPEIISQIGAAAPAVTVGKEVVETAQSNPTGLIITILIIIIAIGGFMAWRKIKALQEVRDATG